MRPPTPNSNPGADGFGDFLLDRSDLIKFNTHKTVSNILAVSVSKTDDLKKCISPSNFFLKNENLLGEK